MAPILNAHNFESLHVLDDAVCVMGVFDGVHAGHRQLIGEAATQARDTNRRCVIITFDRDPDEMLTSDLVKIMSNEARIRMLSGLCDDVVVIEFNKELASMEPTEFLNTFFVKNKPHDLYVGKDFRYGIKASGDIDTLAQWGNGQSVEIHPITLLCKDGVPVKSTRIRDLLAQGDIKEANNLLGQPYSVGGVVRHGRGDGQKLGFQTANLSIPSNELAIGDGVYAGYALIGDKRYKAAISVGASPTFEEATDNIEVHILDFDGDIYDKKIQIEFVEYLRPMIKFDNIDDLISTVKNNIEYIRAEL